MNPLTLKQISEHLESENSRDRMIALASLRQFPADDAVPLIKKVLDDQSLQVRLLKGKALFSQDCFS